jgi:hypothetical protein
MLEAENVEALEDQYLRSINHKRKSSKSHKRKSSTSHKRSQATIPTQQDVFATLSEKGGTLKSRASLIFFSGAGGYQTIGANRMSGGIGAAALPPKSGQTLKKKNN